MEAIGAKLRRESPPVRAHNLDSKVAEEVGGYLHAMVDGIKMDWGFLMNITDGRLTFEPTIVGIFQGY